MGLWESTTRLRTMRKTVAFGLRCLPLGYRVAHLFTLSVPHSRLRRFRLLDRDCLPVQDTVPSKTLITSIQIAMQWPYAIRMVSAPSFPAPCHRRKPQNYAALGKSKAGQ